MYPRTEFHLVDNTEFVDSTSGNSDAPLFLAGITSDKGPEELMVVDEASFTKLFGDVSFAKHGQPLLQTARTLSAGGQVLLKRIVAEDSTLANIFILAKVKTVQEQKVNDQGQPVYVLDGVETTDPTGATAVMVDVAEVKYEVQSVAGAKSIEEVATAAESLFSDVADVDGYKTFPMYVFADIGRGTSNKRIRISADFTESKRYDYVRYLFEVIEDSAVSESAYFSADYEMVSNSENVSLESIVKNYLDQVKADVLETYVSSFVDELVSITGLTRTELFENDVLFGNTKNSKDLQGIKLADSSVSLSHVFGISLDNGDNGAFGSTPLATPEYEDRLTDFFSGVATDDIYDLDQFKIDCCVDANYPPSAKRAIEDLAEFRGDFFFFRDQGIINTYEMIESINLDAAPSYFSATYMLSYDVIDPYSKKQITVTVGYSLARILVEHFENGRHRPVAGLNNAVLSEAIKGTINYLPKVTPGVNQKQDLIDIRVNYANYYDDSLVLETQYTSQLKLSQFSYVSNILAIQEVVKAVRTKCPRIRYNFIDGDDLEVYKQDVEAVINRFTDNFKTITFEYVADSNATRNKQFKAAIYVQFRDYAESEYFTIYAVL